MPNERLTYLFFRYFQKTASREELDELMQLLDQPENEEAVNLLMEEAYLVFEPSANVFSDAQSERLLMKIQAAQPPAKRRSLWWRAAAAAAIILSLCAGWWVINRQP